MFCAFEAPQSRDGLPLSCAVKIQNAECRMQNAKCKMQNRRTKQEQRVLAHYALQEGGKAHEVGLKLKTNFAF